MDSIKIGKLVKKLRLEKGLTQKELGNLLYISDKAVSKWERGEGYPDISILPTISEIFQVPLETLMSGEMELNEMRGNTLKNIKFYYCPDCGNVLSSIKGGDLACCGKLLKPLKAQKAEEKLNVEIIDKEYFVFSDHEMTKENYISFLAFVNGDTILIRKLYPEWDLQTRIPKLSRGTLYWYSTVEGLYYQYLK